MIDVSCREIERIDIGHAPGAVDNAIGHGGMFDALMGEDHPQPVICRLDWCIFTLFRNKRLV